jgi:hypothetical protein
MPVYIEYAIKVSVCLAAAFLFYTWLLKRMTYYRWNRLFLLLFQLVSFVVPFIDIGVFVPEQGSGAAIINKMPTIHSYEVMTETTNSKGMHIYWQVLSVVFLLVSFILSMRLLIQYLSIQKLKSKASLWLAGKENIYNVAEPILPFSFLNDIFVNTNNYSHSELQKIISHERIHVRDKHSVDMLLTELVCILNWYNPFAWMIKNAVRENLEFIADDGVINDGADKKNYQHLLLKVSGQFPSSIASSFKFSSLRNRVVMMNKTKTPAFHLLKFVLIAPIVAILLIAFRDNSTVSKRSSVSASRSSAATYTLSNLTYSIRDEKVKSIVLRERDKSLLKVGDELDLQQIYIEKVRLKNLLESNGYSNLKSNAIRFMVDTALVRNSFSIEIKIDVEGGVALNENKRLSPYENIIGASKLDLQLSQQWRSERYMINESRFVRSKLLV